MIGQSRPKINALREESARLGVGELGGMALAPLNPTQKSAHRIPSWIFCYKSLSTHSARLPHSTLKGGFYNLETLHIHNPHLTIVTIQLGPRLEYLVIRFADFTHLTSLHHFFVLVSPLALMI